MKKAQGKKRFSEKNFSVLFFKMGKKRLDPNIKKTKIFDDKFLEEIFLFTFSVFFLGLQERKKEKKF